jgi:hypothetical protein
MAASIQLTDGRSFTVSESVAEIQEAIASLGSAITPMIRLTEFGPGGQAVLVSAANIASARDLG